jgi:uncharacterized protein (TIGR02217 family)
MPSTFPVLAGLKFDSKKTPIWKTGIQESASGIEQRATRWSYPRWKFSLTFEFLRDDSNAEFQTLVSFFNSMKGMYDYFYYSDPSENSETAQGLGTGNGTQTDFPLVKSLGSFVEPVFHAPTVTAVYKDGVVQATGWTLVASSGGYGNDTIRFSSAPANGVVITADFTFVYVCRFDADEVEFNYMMKTFWECQQLDFKSVK